MDKAKVGDICEKCGSQLVQGSVPCPDGRSDCGVGHYGPICEYCELTPEKFLKIREAEDHYKSLIGDLELMMYNSPDAKAILLKRLEEMPVTFYYGDFEKTIKRIWKEAYPPLPEEPDEDKKRLRLGWRVFEGPPIVCGFGDYLSIYNDENVEE